MVGSVLVSVNLSFYKLVPFGRKDRSSVMRFML